MSIRFIYVCIVIVVACNFFAQIAIAQRTCGTMSHLQAQIEKDPSLIQKREAMERRLQEIIRQKYEGNTRQAQVVITIPVVFHVLYNNGVNDPTNLSDEQILSQLEVLNEEYRALNVDIGDVPGPFEDLIADCEIEFCLAGRSPNGTACSGITRKLTTVTVFNADTDDCKFNSSGGTNIWDRDDYLNIWIVPGLQDNDGNTLLGYAQFPGMGSSTDGVVCLYTTIGRPPHNDFDTDFNLGRTATHEVGHWLNLNHIWGDDCNTSDQCDGTDNVSDTPNQQCANYNCPDYPLTDDCTSDNPGVLFMNYMDYVDDVCMFMFTNGQKNRMRATLDDERLSITESDKCCPGSWAINSVTYPAGTDNYYKASSFISSSDVSLTTGNNFVFQAGNYVDLKEGFMANTGCVFFATNAGCDELTVDTKLIGD